MAETSGSVHDSAVAKGEAPDTDAVLQQTESFTHGTIGAGSGSPKVPLRLLPDTEPIRKGRRWGRKDQGKGISGPWRSCPNMAELQILDRIVASQLHFLGETGGIMCTRSKGD